MISSVKEKIMKFKEADLWINSQLLSQETHKILEQYDDKFIVFLLNLFNIFFKLT